MTKAALRTLYKQKRLALTAAEKDKLEDLILIQFQQLPISFPDVVMTYAPIQKLAEYNPVLIEEYCIFKNPATRLVYPVANFTNNTLQAFEVEPDTYFDVNSYGIDEPIDGTPLAPTDIDMMLVPLLTFNEQGYRVGYGKGFYDKFIAQCKQNIILIGISFFEPAIIDDVHYLDEKLDFCITPNRIYAF